MIPTFRASARLAGLLALTLVCWLAVLLGLLLTMPSHRARRWVQRTVFRAWSRAFCRLLGARISTRGEPPRPPCLVVSNHLSYVDVMVLASVLPARFVAKAEVRRWPIIGVVSRSVDTLFVDRAARRDALRVGREMAEGLRRGDAILLFPEGTSTAGHTVTPFKPPLLAPAALERLPVHYAACRYVTPPGQPPAHLRVCWWGDMPFLTHFWRMMAMPGFRAEVTFGPAPLTDHDRKELARRLHAGVSELFEPVVDHEPQSTGYR
ncbi:MAG TPA: lysophospholipid acyltransferase family protein [Thermoanaerobaculia bacterium]|nr:lysophospholipid acyltransferase family protein [Thermoanaerobaculia bacterium]